MSHFQPIQQPKCLVCEAYHTDGHPLEAIKEKQRASAKRTNSVYADRSAAAKKAWATKRKIVKS